MKKGASHVVRELTRDWTIEKKNLQTNTITISKKNAFSASHQLISSLEAFLNIQNLNICVKFSKKQKTENITISGFSKDVFLLLEQMKGLDPNIVSVLGAEAVKGVLINDLPPEICAEIARFLDTKSVFQLAISCKNAYLLVKDATNPQKSIVSRSPSS